jgi:predicted metal-binding membrane protein
MSARRWVWRHPEVSVLGLSAVAWVLLFAPIGLPGSMSMVGMSMQMDGPHEMHREMSVAMSMAGVSGTIRKGGMSGSMRLAAMPRSLRMTGVPGAIPTGDTASASHGRSMHWTLQMFVLMAVAMMLPSATESVRLTAALSLWRRRIRAIVEWIVAFMAVWLLAGAAILCARELATHNGLLRPGRVPMMVGLLVAAVWQLTPIKRLALNGCHRTRPLAPYGLRADRDCVLYGAMIGRECVVSCGPMMAAMTLGDRNQAIVMVGATAIVLAERLRHRSPRRASATALSLLAVAVL